MLWKLIKIRLQGMFRRNVSRGGRRKKGTALLFGLLMLYCLGVFCFMFYMMFSALAEAFWPLEHFRWFYFALVGLMSFALSFFLTAFTAKSELFEAKDNELLLAMPIRPRLIFLSRMAVLMGTEYLISLIVMIPAGIAWFAAAGFNAVTLVLYCLASLLLPVCSAGLACFIGWLLARLTARARNKTLVTMVFSLLFLAVYFVVYFNANAYLQKLLLNYQALAGGMMGWGFLFYWYGAGIAAADPLLLLGFAAVCLAVLTLTVYLLGRSFLKVTATGTAKKKKKSSAAQPQLRRSTLSAALLKKEFKRFTSSAIYMMNCGLGLILSVIAAVALLLNADAIRGFLKVFSFLTPTELALAASIVLSFLASMDMITAPSISLEGKNLWILRTAPVPAGKILSAKLKLHLCLCAPVTLLLSVAAGIVLQSDLPGWLALVLVPQLFVLLAGVFGLTINLLLPKLDWTNEAVPVKQSMSVLVTMLSTMIFIVLAVMGFLFLVMRGIMSAAVYFSLVIAVAALWLLLSWLWLCKRGPKRFDRL